MNIIPDIETVILSELTLSKFYKEHLIKSYPVRISDGCMNWAAIKDAKIQPKWKYDYLIKNLITSKEDEYKRIPSTLAEYDGWTL
jgi:hypothetical protein